MRVLFGMCERFDSKWFVWELMMEIKIVIIEKFRSEDGNKA